MSVDYATEFEFSRNRSYEYPANIVRTEAFAHALESYKAQLGEKGVFHPDIRSLACIDLYDKNDSFHLSKPLNTLEKLSGYIDEEDGAPLWRMVFLQSASSRGALGCSREQLTHLLTYYQVMPSFLDFVLTFKGRVRPVARALFRHENYLDKDSAQFPLPELGRSGLQMQHAFNLMSVERASDPAEKNQWPLRQIALYHSFDVTNGRCLWILLKGNQAMAKRIFAATKNHRHLRASAIKSPETSFVASLQLQSMVMEWCIEYWGDYIDHLEDELNGNSGIAKVTDLTEEMENNFIRRTTFQSVGSRPSSAGMTPPGSPPASPGRNFRTSSSDLFSILRRMSGLKGRQSSQFPGEKAAATDLEAALVADQEGDEGDEADFDTLTGLNKQFSFKRFQRLSLLGDELGRGLVVIEQNKGVLREIEEHYRSAVESYAFKTHMEAELYAGELSSFFRRIGSVIRDLDIHHSRLTALSRALENDKILLSAMLQYKSERTAEFFASSAKISSDRMEDWTVKMHTIAVRTEQETVSMHVITIFTLIFLPCTFISTFFSSGVLDWDDDGSKSSAWELRPNAMKLFLYISFPMMGIVVGAWLVLYFFMRRRSKRKLEAALLPLVEDAGEKDGDA